MKQQNRFLFTLKKLTPVCIAYQLHHKEQDSQAYRNTCIAMRKVFQELGPTYIKLGQLLSARPDIVGVPLAQELRNLLDNEPIIPFSEIEKVLVRAWSQDPKKILRKIEHTPIATASIAQVHKATLHSGHIVAIKVRRPGIEDLIKRDLIIFKRITWFLDKMIHLKGLKFSYIYQQFAEWIQNELDFQVEGRRADKFRENLENLPGIVIPKIEWEHTKETVLIMEYIEGYTINDILLEMQRQHVTSIYDVTLDFHINPDLLISHLIGAIAHQVFMDKYFHGDLHPANLIIQKNNQIAFIDFGIIGTLNNEEETQILLTLLAIVEGDPQALVKIVTSLIPENLSKKELAELHQAFADELRRLHEDENGKISLNHFVSVLFTVIHKYYVVWNAGFLLAIKTLGQVDSLCQLIGLKSSVIELMRPHIDKAVTASLTSTFSQESVFKSVLDLMQAGKKLPQTLNQLEDMVNTQNLLPKH